MRLQALCQGPHTTPDAHQFPGYILHLGEGKLQTKEKQPVQLPASVKALTNEKEMIFQVFFNLQSNFLDEEWLLRRAILTTRNKRLMRLDGIIESTVSGMLQEFYTADSVNKAEVNERNYPVEVLTLIAATASLLDRVLSIKKGYIVV